MTTPVTKEAQGSDRIRATLGGSGSAQAGILGTATLRPKATVAGSGRTVNTARTASSRITTVAQGVARAIADQANGGSFLARAVVRATGREGTAVRSGRDRITAAVTGAASTAPTTAAGGLLAARVTLQASGFGSGMNAAARSALRAQSYPVGRLLPNSDATGTFRARAALSAVGVESVAVRQGRDGLTAAVSAVVNPQNDVQGTGLVHATSALVATGTSDVQVVTAATSMATAAEGLVREVVRRVGVAVLSALNTVMEATGIAVYEEAEGSSAISAVVQATRNPAGTQHAEAALHQGSVLFATGSRVIDYVGTLDSSLTGTFSVDPAGLPSGTGYFESRSQVFAAATAGPAVSGQGLLGTASVMVAPGRVTAIAARASAVLVGGSQVAVDGIRTIRANTAVLIGRASMAFQTTFLPVALGFANLDQPVRFLLDQFTGAVSERPTVTRDGHVLRAAADMRVRFSIGGTGGAALLGGARAFIDATGIPAVDAGLVSTLTLRGKATLSVAANLLSTVLTFPALAPLLAKAKVTVAGAATATTAVAPTFRAQAAMQGAGAVTDLNPKQGVASATAQARMLVAGGSFANPLMHEAVAFLEGRTRIVAPETYLFNQPAASTVTAGARVAVEPNKRGGEEFGTAALQQVRSRLDAHGQQRTDAVLTGRARVTVDARVFDAPVTATAHLRQQARATCVPGAQPEFGADGLAVTARAEMVVTAEALADPLTLIPLTATVAAVSRLVHAPPLAYAGADLRATARLTRQHAATARLRSRSRAFALGMEGSRRSGSRSRPVAGPVGFTRGVQTPSRTRASGGTTSTSGATPAANRPLRVGPSTGTTNARETP